VEQIKISLFVHKLESQAGDYLFFCSPLDLKSLQVHDIHACRSSRDLLPGIPAISLRMVVSCTAVGLVTPQITMRAAYNMIHRRSTVAQTKFEKPKGLFHSVEFSMLVVTQTSSPHPYRTSTFT